MTINNLNLTNKNLITIRNAMYSRLDTLFQELNEETHQIEEDASKKE